MERMAGTDLEGLCVAHEELGRLDGWGGHCWGGGWSRDGPEFGGLLQLTVGSRDGRVRRGTEVGEERVSELEARWLAREELLMQGVLRIGGGLHGSGSGGHRVLSNSLGSSGGIGELVFLCCLNKSLYACVLMRYSGVVCVRGADCAGRGEEMTTWILVAWITMLWTADAQTLSCCEQCKKGYVYKNGINTRVFCNIPGQTPYAGWGDCVSVCTNGGLSEYCMSCEDNYYMDFSRCTSPCLACAAGKVGTGNPDDQCQRCQPGYRIENYGCTQCVPGKYQDGTHQTSCKNCQTNYYSDTAGATICYQQSICAAGTYMSKDATITSNRECTPCPAGTYSEYRNIDSTCSSCPSGKYQSFQGMTFCYEHAPCVPSQKQISAGTSTQDFVCENCVSPWTTRLGSQTACSDCVAGKYKLGSTTCTDCNCVSQGEVYINCPVGSTAKGCNFCTGTQPGSYCEIGKQPSEVCNGMQTQDVQCVPCPAGKYKSVANSRSCVDCLTGFYKLPPASTASCTACSNKPSNAVYLPWTRLDGTRTEPSTSDCPW